MLAADLGCGRDVAGTGAVVLIARAVAGLPTGTGRPRVGADAGYFAASVSQAAVDAGADFSIGVRRNPAVWRALDRVPVGGWLPALGCAIQGCCVSAEDLAHQAAHPVLLGIVEVDPGDSPEYPRTTAVG